MVRLKTVVVGGSDTVRVITVRSSPEFYSDYCEIGVLSTGLSAGVSFPNEHI